MFDNGTFTQTIKHFHIDTEMYRLNEQMRQVKMNYQYPNIEA